MVMQMAMATAEENVIWPYMFGPQLDPKLEMAGDDPPSPQTHLQQDVSEW